MTTIPAPTAAAVARTCSIIACDSLSDMPDVGSSSSRNTGPTAAARASSNRRELP